MGFDIRLIIKRSLTSSFVLTLHQNSLRYQRIITDIIPVAIKARICACIQKTSRLLLVLSFLLKNQPPYETFVSVMTLIPSPLCAELSPLVTIPLLPSLPRYCSSKLSKLLSSLVSILLLDRCFRSPQLGLIIIFPALIGKVVTTRQLVRLHNPL